MAKDPNLITVSICLPEEMHQTAADHAQAQDLTFSAYVRRLIRKDLLTEAIQQTHPRKRTSSKKRL